MHGHAWTCKVATAHTHGRFFLFTYIHINVMHVCVCTLAHLRIHGSKNLDQWAAQQQSRAAHRRSAFLYTLLSNAAFTHTRTYSCAACRTGCSRYVTQKKTALSASQIAAPAAAQRTLKLELHSHTLSPTLSRTLYFCALHILRRAQLTAAAARLRLQLQFTLHWRSLTLSLSSFLPHPKGFLFSFPLTVVLLCLGCCCCYLCCTVSAALLLALPSTSFIRIFGCFRLLLLPAVQGVSLFCFVLALFGYF